MLYLHARMFKYEIIILFYEFKFRMAKITISELEIVRSSMPTPISVSVMAKVNKNLPRWKVQISNWEGADMMNFSLVATCTDTSKNGMINEEKNFSHQRENLSRRTEKWQRSVKLKSWQKQTLTSLLKY